MLFRFYFILFYLSRTLEMHWYAHAYACGTRMSGWSNHDCAACACLRGTTIPFFHCVPRFFPLHWDSYEDQVLPVRGNNNSRYCMWGYRFSFSLLIRGTPNGLGVWERERERRATVFWPENMQNSRVMTNQSWGYDTTSSFFSFFFRSVFFLPENLSRA